MSYNLCICVFWSDLSAQSFDEIPCLLHDFIYCLRSALWSVEKDLSRVLMIAVFWFSHNFNILFHIHLTTIASN